MSKYQHKTRGNAKTPIQICEKFKYLYTNSEKILMKIRNYYIRLKDKKRIQFFNLEKNITEHNPERR